MLFRLSIAALALVATACGGEDKDAPPGGAADRRRTVDVVMTDVKFTPDTLSVAKGETVTFRFRNDGKLEHDAFVGDAAAQAKHEKEMREEKDGHGHEDDEDAVTVHPGKTEELTYTFDTAGQIEVGCHEPGHYDAGMRIVVTVT